MTKMTEKQKRLEKLKSINSFFVTLFFALIITLAVRIIFCPILVSGSSMNPTFKDGEVVLCTSEITSLSHGDVIVIKVDGLQMIKRVVALPGDDLWVTDGQLYVNGAISEWNYEKIEDEHVGNLSSPLHLNEGEYFVMGDNRNNSKDSRNYGPITKEQMRHKVNSKLFSSEAIK